MKLIFFRIKFKIFQIKIHVPMKNGKFIKKIMYFENVLLNIDDMVCTSI